MNGQPLEGLTVLEFGQVYNGPYCGFLLAQAGARVIKVESLRGESLRPHDGRGPGAYPFAVLNAGKQGIAIDLKKEAGQRIVRALARKVDVVFDNYAPGVMERNGVGAEALRRENARLIYASGSGYGASGPNRDVLGMDITLQATTGIMSVTGEEGGPPLKTPATFIDILTGTHLYAGIVTALVARERTGAGAVLDVSMQDCAVPALGTALGAYYSVGEQLPRAGSRHPGKGLAPYNVYRAKDGHVALLCLREGHWRRLCRAMGRPELARDARFADNARRCRNIDEVDALVGDWTSGLTRDAFSSLAQEHGVIGAPVRDLAEVVGDPHLQARGSLVPREHPTLGTIAQPRTPLRFAGVSPPDPGAEPALGGDTESVLGELLELGGAEIAALVADAVVALPTGAD